MWRGWAIIALVVSPIAASQTGCGGRNGSAAPPPSFLSGPQAGAALARVYLANQFLVLVPNFGPTLSSSGDLLGFQIDTTGRIISIPGSPFGSGNALPTPLTPDPLGRFIFGGTTPGMATFAVNSSGGTLLQTGVAPASALLAVVAPSGRFLYLTDGGTVFGYAVNADGALMHIQSVPTEVQCTSDSPCGASHLGMTLDASGSFLYVAEGVSVCDSPAKGGCVFGAKDRTLVYAVDAGTGNLTLIDSAAPQSQFNTGGIAVDPRGEFVYVQGFTAGHEQMLVYSSKGGHLSLVQTANCDCTAISGAGVLTMHPSGRFLYEVTFVPNGLGVVRRALASDGKLSPGEVAYESPSTPLGFQVSLTAGGEFLVVAETGTNIVPEAAPFVHPGKLTVFAVDPNTGALSLSPGSPIVPDAKRGWITGMAIVRAPR